MPRYFVSYAHKGDGAPGTFGFGWVELPVAEPIVNGDQLAEIAADIERRRGIQMATILSWQRFED